MSAEQTFAARRNAVDEWETKVIQPLIDVRDHLHWRAVTRRDVVAGWAEGMVAALLRLAHDHRVRIARGEQ